MGATRRVTLKEAAEIIGVSKEAVRKRVIRGTLRSDMGGDGRRYVYIDTGGDTVADKPPTHEHDVLISEMVEGLRDEVHYLREQLHQELERRSAEAERYQQIVAALTATNASIAERLQALEAPSDEREAPEPVEEEPERAEPHSARGETQEDVRRPWWRRWFGG